MSEHFLLGVLILIAAIVNLYGLLIVRDVHRLTAETLLKANVLLDLTRKQ